MVPLCIAEPKAKRWVPRSPLTPCVWTEYKGGARSGTWVTRKSVSNAPQGHSVLDRFASVPGPLTERRRPVRHVAVHSPRGFICPSRGLWSDSAFRIGFRLAKVNPTPIR